MDFFSPELIGAIMIGCMLFAIFIGFPISFTLIFLGLVFGYWGFGKLVFYLMTLQFNMIMTESTLVAVPLFIFMGILMESAGLMERLFNSVQLMLSKTRGSTILCCNVCVNNLCCCYRYSRCISHNFRNYGW